MDKQILHSHKVLIHATTWINLENFMLSEKKPDTKGHMLYNFIHMKCSKQAQRQKANQWLPGAGVKGE